MTKAEIVSKIASQIGIDKNSVLAVVESYMETVKNAVSNGDNVYLRGFGSFVCRKRAAKTARNITKNTTMIVPEHLVPSFKPANEFKEQVREKK